MASRLLVLLSGACLAGGCLAHRDAAKVVDPVLKETGSAYQRERSAGGFALGPYEVRKGRLKRWPAGDRTVGAPTPTSSRRPGEFIELDAQVTAPGGVWSVRCEAVREPTSASDYGAVLDENGEAVQLECTMWMGAGERWVFAAEGLLSENIKGTLQPEATSVPGGALNVEVLMWRERFSRVRRHLPHAVAQVRAGKTAVAAMVLARPEQAWLASKAAPVHRDVAMVTLAALRLLPFGYEG